MNLANAISGHFQHQKRGGFTGTSAIPGKFCKKHLSALKAVGPKVGAAGVSRVLSLEKSLTCPCRGLRATLAFAEYLSH